jgi:hypothetical protein
MDQPGTAIISRKAKEVQMKFEIDGKEVEKSFADMHEELKADPEYNAELDRMRVKGETDTRATLAGEHQTALDVITAAHKVTASEHATALEAAKNVSSDEKDKQIAGLNTQIETIAKTLETEKADRIQSGKDKKKADTRGELITALSEVDDPYHQKNIARDAMDLFDVESGEFKLSSGLNGSVADMVADMKEIHKDKFLSKQNSGNGIRGDGRKSLDLPADATPSQKRAAEINERLNK